MEKEIKSLKFKDVFAETRKSRQGFSLHLFFFALFTILSLMLAYVAPLSLIITIPFIIVPSYFAFTSVNAIKGKKNAQNVGFFTMFRNYFSILFFGGYRLLFGLLKAFITYVASNFIIILVYDLTIFSKSQDFQDFMKIVEESTDPNALNEAYNKFVNSILTNPEIQKWIYLSLAISFALASIVFIHHIFKHSIKMRRNLFSPNAIPTRQFNFVERKVRKDNRKFIWGSYIRTSWFIQVLIVLAASGGLVLSYFFLKDFRPEQALVISLFLMFIVTLPLMNYISKLQDMLFFILLPAYEVTFTTLTLDLLNKYKDKIGLEEEELKKLEKLLNVPKDQIKEETKEEKKDLEDK